MSHREQPGSRPRVVVVGGGFAGLTAIRELAGSDCDITLVDRHNYHCFQPLLYQVATAGLSPGNIAPALRWVLRRQANVSVMLADAQTIDLDSRSIVAQGIDGRGHELDYDWLVVAAGARHSYFGHAEWEDAAPGLKTVDDALEIRRRVLSAFERAELTSDLTERRGLTTFVVVGGGPTGVELAGQLAEMARRTLRREYRSFDTADSSVELVEASERILGVYPPELSAAAERSLQRLGVRVRRGHPVIDVNRQGLTLKTGPDTTEHIAAATVIWAAGNEASPLARSLAMQSGADLDRLGRIMVEPSLSLPGHPEAFAIGDMAAVGAPAVAPAAMQQGRHAGRLIADEVLATAPNPRRPFRYRDKGSVATIGRNHAVADFGRVRLRGRLAWLVWLVVHLLYLVGYANRAIVLLRWAVAYVTFGRGERAITEQSAGACR